MSERILTDDPCTAEAPRRLKGEECECIPCGIVFENELAFDSHISGGRHVRPTDSAGVA